MGCQDLDIVQGQYPHHFTVKPGSVICALDDAGDRRISHLMQNPCVPFRAQGEGHAEMLDHILQFSAQEISRRDLIHQLQDLPLRELPSQCFQKGLLLARDLLGCVGRGQ